MLLTICIKYKKNKCQLVTVKLRWLYPVTDLNCQLVTTRSFDDISKIVLEIEFILLSCVTRYNRFFLISNAPHNICFSCFNKKKGTLYIYVFWYVYFVTCTICIFLTKTQYYGVQNIAKKWFKTYWIPWIISRQV